MINSEIILYNIKYTASVGTKDPEFLEYDCSGTPHVEEREVFHMRDFFAAGQVFRLIVTSFYDKDGPDWT